jgi:hypothetical protein
LYANGTGGSTMATPSVRAEFWDELIRQLGGIGRNEAWLARRL